MPQFQNFPYPRRYNSLRLTGYGYNSPYDLCAITMSTHLRVPVFADTRLAKSVLSSLLSDQNLSRMRVKAYTLMPDHLHFLATVRNPASHLPSLIGSFESYTTQLYWKRSNEIVKSQEVCLPPSRLEKIDRMEARPILAALRDWRANLRPEVVELKSWPRVRPQHFLRKRLWQREYYDHVIRNDQDLRENLNYIAMNAVKAGYVSCAQFYPYTGFLE
ncbi:MAG: REP-associated tyrosine transposase [Acidobacteriota bacterium]|nr:REP-associated tyrosine transposase [Acidobacteriota bacterium]